MGIEGYLFCVLLLSIIVPISIILISRVIQWFGTLTFNDALIKIIYNIAFRRVTEGYAKESIYKKNGDIRVSIANRIAAEQQVVAGILYTHETEILDVLRLKGLADNYDMIANSRINEATNIVYAYIESLNEASKATIAEGNGVPPDDFFRIKNQQTGDCVGVYIIHNETKNMYYVGQAKRLFFRVNQHFTGHGNGDVYADYKYGDIFKIQLLKLVDSGYSDIDKLESDMIRKYNAYTQGYNRNKGNG